MTPAILAEPVTLSALHSTAAATSMALPLHLINDLPEPSKLVFHAEPGAFDDLAVDARIADGWTDRGSCTATFHLPPARPTSPAPRSR